MEHAQLRVIGMTTHRSVVFPVSDNEQFVPIPKLPVWFDHRFLAPKELLVYHMTILFVVVQPTIRGRVPLIILCSTDGLVRVYHTKAF